MSAPRARPRTPRRRQAQTAPRPRRPSRRRPRGRRRALAVGGVALAAVAGGLLLAGGGQSDVQRVAEDFAAAWAGHDYARMYSDVDSATRRSVSVTQFAAYYRQAELTATATSLQVAHAAAPQGSTVPVPVVVATRIFGVLRLPYEIPVSADGGSPRVVWNQSLAFPGLRAGEVLTRSTSLPPRAALLARDGTPIASIGAASADVLGSLGPTPPARAAALRAAGYPRNAMVGVSGLQRIFEERLAGAPGGELFAGARRLAISSPQTAAALRTTIAPRMQRAAVAALAGRLGAVIVLRPATGEILAIAGLPFSALQPPGSTFKIVTLAAALEAGVARPQTKFPVSTYATLSGVKLQNANGESCGGTLANAFAVSCNSVFAPLGAKIGARRLVQTAEKLGFNQRSPIRGVAESTIPPAEQIGDDLAVGSSAIGQGQVQATTLQMTLIAATIGNLGKRPTPTLALGESGPPAPAISPSVARTVRRLMVGVVEHGTGTAAAIHGVRVAGKTGTAELRTTVCPNSANGPNAAPQSQTQTDQTQQQPKCDAKSPKNTDAWFVAVAPSAAPRVAVGVLLVANGAGGDTAAPVAHDVLVAALGRA